MVKQENLSLRRDVLDNDGGRRMAQFTLDHLLQKKKQIEEELRALGGTADGQQRAALHDDPSTEGRKNEIRATLNHIGNLSGVKIINPRQDIDVVGEGNQVSLLWEDESQSESYLLLGPDDTNFQQDKLGKIISYESPVGAAILGKRVGSVVTYTLPNRQESKAKIVAIEPGNF